MSTIKEIAKLAGVSPTTVSNVFHSRTSKVSDKTMKKVQSALTEMNYVSNMGGRLLAKHGSKIIGVILHNANRSYSNVMRDPFISEIVGALENNIRINGYFMMLYTSANVEESLRMATSWDVEGMVVLGCNECECREMMKSSKAPIVFIDSYVREGDMNYFNIGLKDRIGGYVMTKYLISQGHRRIAFLANAEAPIGVDLERFEGMKQALDEFSIPYSDKNYIYLHQILENRHTMIMENIDNWLKSYTALFFASDFYAMDAVNLFYDLHISVPNDISVCGFDDNIFASQCRPKLTTMRQKVGDKAAMGIKLLLQRIRKEPIPEKNILLDAYLYIRNSVRYLD